MSNPQNTGPITELVHDGDTVVSLPNSARVRAAYYLLLAAFFAWQMWNMATGAGGDDQVPGLLRFFVAIVCAATAKRLVRDALAQWRLHRSSGLGPAVERIDSPGATD